MYDFKLLNKGAYSAGAVANMRAKPESGSAIVYASKDFCGILSGNYDQRPDGVWYQLQSVAPGWIYVYVNEKDVTLKSVSPVGNQQAQAVIDAIITRDKETLTNLLISAEYCKRLQRKGHNVSYYKKQIKDTYLSLYSRNQKLKGSPALEKKVEGRNTLTSFSTALSEIVNDASIGLVISTTALIVIIIIAVVGGATAAYYSFSIDSDKSKIDYETAEKIRGLLENVDKSVQNQIIDIVNKEKGKSYTAGRFGGGIMNILKFSAIGLGAFFLIKQLNKS